MTAPSKKKITIWFGASLAALLGVGIVSAIAAGPKAAATLPATTTASTATTAATATTVPATTVPATTVLATTNVPATVAPAVETKPLAAAFLTAIVVDGDTITMSDGTTVRLIGIDTPERGQCGYDESSALMAQLIGGQKITLVPGAREDVDRYGRLLRYVEVSGVDVDLKMIESGRAIARYDGRDGYGVHPRQDAYVAADDATPSTNVCTVTPAVTVAPIAVVPFVSVPTITVPSATAATPAGVYYKNCTEVRAAGAAPIHPGDPGWQSKFDRDGDGVGCE